MSSQEITSHSVCEVLVRDGEPGGLEELQPSHYVLVENKAKSPTTLTSGESHKKKTRNIEP